MAAIALAESGGNAAAVGGPNRNGTRDYGAWQINEIHKTILATGDWRDLNANALMAKRVFDMQGYTAWTVYKTGAYRSHLADTTSTVGKVEKAAASPSVVEPAADPGGITGAVSSLGNLPRVIERVAGNIGVILAAAFLFAAGLFLLFKKDLWKGINAVGEVVT